MQRSKNPTIKNASLYLQSCSNLVTNNGCKIHIKHCFKKPVLKCWSVVFEKIIVAWDVHVGNGWASSVLNITIKYQGMTYHTIVTKVGQEEFVTQNCRPDKIVGSSTSVKRVFITTMTGSRLDAFACVLKKKATIFEQLYDSKKTKESIVSLLRFHLPTTTNLTSLGQCYSLTFLTTNWHWQSYDCSTCSMTILTKYSESKQRAITTNGFLGDNFKSLIGADTKPD